MREVARIACHRGWRQEELARRYREATGGKVSSRNIKRHFESSRLSKKVVATYTRVLGMPDHYTSLLMDRQVRDWDDFGIDSAIEYYLSPKIVEPLFEDGAVSDVVRIMMGDPTLPPACIYAAELAHQRHLAMPGSRGVPGLPIKKDTLLAAGVDEGYSVKWMAAARILKPHYDLISRITDKPPERIQQEEALLKIWDYLDGLMGRELNFEGAVWAPGMRWDEWLAIEHVLAVVFERKRLPVEKMRERLHSNSSFNSFEANRAWRPNLLDNDDGYEDEDQYDE